MAIVTGKSGRFTIGTDDSYLARGVKGISTATKPEPRPMIFSTSMRASLREMPEWKGRIVGARDGQRVCETKFLSPRDSG